MENHHAVRPIAEGDYVQSLDKGLSVLRAFSDEHSAMTLSEVARLTGLSKPSARRFLLTFQALGYMESNDGVFRLRPRVLDLGYAYLSSVELPSVVDPFLNELNAEVREACSVGVLDDDSIFYLARASAQKRIMTFSVRVGTRVDPLRTSVGRVILASLPTDELNMFLDRREQDANLPEGWDRDLFVKNLAAVQEQGWSLVDQEVEVGVRTIAAPIHDARGRVIAGINVAVSTARVPLERLRDEFLPNLLTTRDKIDAEIASYGPGVSLA